MKLVGKKKAQIHLESGWITGEILYRGSKKNATKKVAKLARLTHSLLLNLNMMLMTRKREFLPPVKIKSLPKETPSPQISDDLPTTSSSNSNAVEHVELN
ncbi:unnamed protein product [Brachionus calyciflorus]|uniref:Uncharacterized protein n=1 Tax=Brachionus calyciflorus TaxID=104777 RepID=A0A814RAF5_9BILA|nr:unnamed protein product [Brachionus calyciflorus]